MEKLHGEVEKQLDLFLKNQKTGAEWRKFRETLIGLTDVTHSHFAKLVQVSPTLSTVACMIFISRQQATGTPVALCIHALHLVSELVRTRL